MEYVYVATYKNSEWEVNYFFWFNMDWKETTTTWHFVSTSVLIIAYLRIIQKVFIIPLAVFQ